jgi:catechol 2,3-dioxygenase-like lactoylglutathione lyase family enzyme
MTSDGIVSCSGSRQENVVCWKSLFSKQSDPARTIWRRRPIMPKIKHIAISTQDVDATAKFYIDVFGMKEIAKLDGPGAKGYYLSDGDINLAILNFKNDVVAGVERGKDYSGIHHIGFQVESLEAIAAKLAEAGSQPRDDVNQALGVGPGRANHGNVEVKYSGPDGVMLDVSQTGWVGTSGLDY